MGSDTRRRPTRALVGDEGAVEISSRECPRRSPDPQRNSADILRPLAHSAKADLARVSSVTQWMSRDPVTIGPETTVAEALNQMLFGGFRHLPVMDGDAVVGMVSMRDLAKSIASE